MANDKGKYKFNTELDEKTMKKIKKVAVKSQLKDRLTRMVKLETPNSVAKPTLVYDKTIEIGPGENKNGKLGYLPDSKWYINYCKAYERLVKHAKRAQKSSKKTGNERKTG